MNPKHGVLLEQKNKRFKVYDNTGSEVQAWLGYCFLRILFSLSKMSFQIWWMSVKQDEIKIKNSSMVPHTPSLLSPPEQIRYKR